MVGYPYKKWFADIIREPFYLLPTGQINILRYLVVCRHKVVLDYRKVLDCKLVLDYSFLLAWVRKMFV